jgi:uncharacterized protein (DUF1501 family)
MSFTRRGILGNAAALATLGSIGWHPKMARAAQGERKFLFFFAGGAWDTTTVFDPHYGTNMIDMDPDTNMQTMGRLNFTGGADRPNVERFFRRWGQRTCIVNGLDAHSVGHASGTQLTLTGTSASSYSDWPTTLAANGKGEYPLPHLVFSGPNFAGNSGSAVVRAGGGTLLDLITASINGSSDNPAPAFDSPSDSIVDAYVYGRVANFAAQREISGGDGFRRAKSLLSNMDRSIEIEGRQFEAGLTNLGNTMEDQAFKALEMMRLGLTRTAMIGIPGGWDCHGGVQVNAPQFENFFMALDNMMDYMATTPGMNTQWLIDEVTIVALSEFGRTPRLNGGGGKDHWPFTSALLVGSGVRGGQSVGATDDALVGVPVDLATGQASSSGIMLGTEHLGMAILKLGGLNPEELLPGIESFDAILAG